MKSHNSYFCKITITNYEGLLYYKKTNDDILKSSSVTKRQ